MIRILVTIYCIFSINIVSAMHSNKKFKIQTSFSTEYSQLKTSPRENKYHKTNNPSTESSPRENKYHKTNNPSTESSPRDKKYYKFDTTSTESSPRENRHHKFNNLATKKLLITAETVNLTNKNGDTILIQSIRKNNIETVKTILSFDNVNVNHQNKWKNTALHYAAILKNKDIINLLLLDSRTDASLANNEGNRPRDCYSTIDGNKKDEKIKLHLFYRFMLNIIVHEESFTALVSEPGGNEKTINLAIEEIKKKMKQEYETQEKSDDRRLPTTETNAKTCLPDYATDDFIKKMIMIKLQQ